MRNVIDLFQAAVELNGDELALISGDVRLSWNQLAHHVQRRSRKLQEMGVTRGDTVSIALGHNHELVVSILAVSACDACFVVLNPKLTEGEKVRQVQETSSAVVITSLSNSEDDGFLKSLSDVSALVIPEVQLLDDLTLIHDNDGKSLEWHISESIPADVSNVFFTSGSTGNAKGIIVPHRTLLDGARIVSAYLNIQKTDVILSILPFSFDYGLNQLLLCFQTGARLVMHEFVLPTELVRIISDERVTVLAGVPSLWPKLCEAIERLAKDKRKVDSLRLITTAGGPHPSALLEAVSLAFPGTQIVIMYGLTESFRSTYLDSNHTLKRIGSIGKPVPEVEILILDESGRACAVGEIGELHHRGAFVNYGYLNDPKETKRKYIPIVTAGHGCRPETVVRSGDLASRDAEGFIYFHGRIDSQIKAFGYRVSPSEVESAAISILGVSQAAAFPARDPDYGEVVALAYTCEAGSELSTDELRRKLRQKLASFAVPRIMIEMTELPLTATGKIDYSFLRSIESN